MNMKIHYTASHFIHYFFNITGFSLLAGIRGSLYLNISENLILKDRFWFVYIPLGNFFSTHFRVFHNSVSWRFLIGVWVIASLLQSPRLFSVFWPILITLSFGWPPLVILFPIPPVPLSILWWLHQKHQLQVVSPSHSCSTAFSVL